MTLAEVAARPEPSSYKLSRSYVVRGYLAFILAVAAAVAAGYWLFRLEVFLWALASLTSWRGFFAGLSYFLMIPVGVVAVLATGAIVWRVVKGKD